MKKIIVSAIIMVLLLSCGGPSHPTLTGANLDLKKKRFDDAYDKLSKGLYSDDKQYDGLKVIPEAWFEMAKLHKSKGEVSKAVSALDKIDPIDTKKAYSTKVADMKARWANLDYKMGVDAYNASLGLKDEEKTKKLNDAKNLLNNSNIIEENAGVYNVIGKVEEQLKNVSAAETSYKKAIALADTNTAYSFDLASFYYNNKKYEEAVSQFDNTIKLDPKHKNALKFKAYAYQNLKQYDNAEKSYGALLDVYPNDKDSKSNLEILKTNRMKDEAFAIVAEYNKLIDAKKPNMKKANALLKTSVPMLEALVKTEFYKENFSMWSQLFTVYARLGMKKEAKMAEKKLQSLN